MTRYKIFTLSFFVYLFSFNFSLAALFVNELMYNPQGSDSKREWIEICNSSDELASLGDIKILDGGRMKSATLWRGKTQLNKDECAIISSGAENFADEYPSYSGPILKASISLLNSGEELALYDGDTQLDSVSYLPKSGSDNTGKTLHRNGNEFTVAAASPGNLLPGEQDAEMQEDGGNQNTDDTGSGSDSESQNDNSQYKNINDIPIYKFKVVEIEPPRDIFLRLDSPEPCAESFFEVEPELYDSTGAAVKQFNLELNFGDDSDILRKTPFEHIYKIPGSYNLEVKARAGTLYDKKLLPLDVKKVQLEMYRNGDLIKIKNESLCDLNLKAWTLKSDVGRYKFKHNLYIGSGRTLPLSKNDLFHANFVGELSLFSPHRKYSFKEPDEMPEHSDKDKSETSKADDISHTGYEQSSLYHKEGSGNESYDKKEQTAASAIALKKTIATNAENGDYRNSILGRRISDITKVGDSSKKHKDSDIKDSLSAPSPQLPVSEKLNEKHSQSDIVKLRDTYNSRLKWQYLFFALGLVIVGGILIFLFAKEELDDWDLESE